LKRSPFVLVLLAALVAPSVPAQDQAGPPLFPGFDPGGTMRAWLAGAGAHWRVEWDHATGTPSFLYGGQRPLVPAAQAGDDAALEMAARALVDELAPALGYTSTTLQLVRVKRLDHLMAADTSAKVAVLFEQVTGGVRTWHGSVSVLLGADGRLLALDNGALPHVEQIPLVPETSEDAALAVALAAFANDTGFAATSAEHGDYVVFPAQVAPGKDAVRGVPAYTFKLDAGLDRTGGQLPVIRSYVIAATGTPRVLHSWSHVHRADLTGTVQGWGQVNLKADSYEAEVLHPLKDIRLTGSGIPNTYSNDAGGFTVPSVAAPVSVTATFNGVYSRVTNIAGASASIVTTVTPGVPATITFNAGLTEQQTAEVNAHTFAEAFRDWLRAVDPSETTFDFQQVENVNIASTCNAYYDGVSTNFYLSGGGCPNSAYSTVVWHEVGHWANDLFGSFNGSDGFGEGAADCWSMYIADDPIIAADFYGLGIPIRTGLNTTPFCGDGSPGCYGEVHFDGEPLMGAIWKVRANLESSLGLVAGGDVADHLLVGWFQAYNDAQIKSVIEAHWLTLDDDDGNIDNGTPNYAAIDAGFLAQGFPGYELPLFTFDHTPLTAVNSELAVPVVATVTEENGVLSGVNLYWSNNGGASFSTVSMAPQGGGVWKGFVPGQVSPKTVRYYLDAFGAGGNNTLPKAAPADSFQYDVGSLTVLHDFNFEPVSDEGWTHFQVLTQDDWMHDAPLGKSTDPAAAYSGIRIWGNDLGPEGYNGEYKPDVNNYILSPVFNLSGQTNLRVRFQRWLCVEEAIYDHARFYVNNNVLWENQLNGHTIDVSWTAQDFDIGAYANNNPSVQFKFDLTSDAGLQFGGWNIDDFRVVSLGPVTPTAFTEYGSGTPGTGGVAPHLTGSGTGTPGGLVTLSIASGKRSANGALFVGGVQASLPFAGGTFLVGAPFVQIPLALGPAGSAVVAGTVPADPNLYGIPVYAQYWCADPAAVKGKAGSNGLTFTIE